MENEVKKESDINDSVEEVLGKKKKASIKPVFIGLIILLIIVLIGIALITVNMFSVKEVSVASVNSENISQTALDNFYNQQKAAYESQGLDASDPEQLKAAKQQVLENLVNQTLLLQAAESEGITITDEEVQSEYDRTVGQFETDEELQAALNENNLTIELLRENIVTQLTIQRYLETRIDENVSITDEEIQALYDQYVEDGSNIPAFEEVSNQLGDQIKQQKLDSQVGVIIDELKGVAEIELYLE